jgi:hypothetical protein
MCSSAPIRIGIGLVLVFAATKLESLNCFAQAIRDGVETEYGNSETYRISSDNNDQYGDSYDRQWVGFRDVVPYYYGDPSLNGVDPVADCSWPIGSVFSLDYDAFMGVPDSGWENNGIRLGANFGTRLGTLTERTGICSQFGASLGVYGWSGTDYRLQNRDQAQTQGFLTYGLYHRPTEDSRIVAGLVQDWSFNDTYGVFGENPLLSQLRWQLGYAVNASNDYGVSGSVHVLNDTQTVPFFGETTWQAVSYLNTYWHHKWTACGADTWITLGVPLEERLTGQGSIGDYLVSAIAVCPLNDCVSAVSGVTYMHPSGAPGPAAAVDEMWNFSVGISIYPRRNARSTTVAGQQTMPLLPLANNGSFIVDTDNRY